jgi:ABC-type multidrug transport system ATPase subunit
VVILDSGHVVAAGPLRQLRAGAEDELLVEVDDGPAMAEAVAQWLRDRGGAAVADGSRVIVAVEAPVVYDLVRDALAECGAALHRMGPRTSSLEDVFLAARGALGRPPGPAEAAL